MHTERLLLRYSDGQKEWHTPATVPPRGTVIRRAGKTWIVVATKRRSPCSDEYRIRPSP